MGTLEELGKQRWLLLETHKRDGSWVGTPVTCSTSMPPRS